MAAAIGDSARCRSIGLHKRPEFRHSGSWLGFKFSLWVDLMQRALVADYGVACDQCPVGGIKLMRSAGA
jgi:hypothetical protein